MDLKGKVAIVTGAAQGIGRVYARGLAEDGASVVCADINLSGAEETSNIITGEGGTSCAAELDVSSVESAAAMADFVRSEFSGVDILVNNAALYAGISMINQMEIDIGYWRNFMSVNLDGTLIVTQAVAPMMIESGWGRIVNQSSIGAYSGYGGAYAVSKLGVIGLTQGFARELGPHGITVNAIAPGVIYTEATRGVVPQDTLDAMKAMNPIQKEAQPEDLLGALRYFVSDEAGWTNGQTLIVDGGYQPRL